MADGVVESKRFSGKFALVKGESLIGIFDSETAAIRHGYENLGNVPFLFNLGV
jgi:hypothetical protein